MRTKELVEAAAFPGFVKVRKKVLQRLKALGEPEAARITMSNKEKGFFIEFAFGNHVEPFSFTNLKRQDIESIKGLKDDFDWDYRIDESARSVLISIFRKDALAELLRKERLANEKFRYLDWSEEEVMRAANEDAAELRAQRIRV